VFMASSAWWTVLLLSAMFVAKIATVVAPPANRKTYVAVSAILKHTCRVCGFFPLTVPKHA
jgi:hypothetical protein